MFGNRTESGRNNIAGIAIYNRRKALGISQREVADRLRSHGLVIDKNAVQRMESGERFMPHNMCIGGKLRCCAPIRLYEVVQK